MIKLKYSGLSIQTYFSKIFEILAFDYSQNFPFLTRRLIRVYPPCPSPNLTYEQMTFERYVHIDTTEIKLEAHKNSEVCFRRTISYFLKLFLVTLAFIFSPTMVRLRPLEAKMDFLLSRPLEPTLTLSERFR